MNTHQLTLLDHATALLSSRVPQPIHTIPVPLPTSIATAIAKVSPTTLSRAKTMNRLPYKCSIDGWDIEVHFAHHHAGKDYWKICFSHVG